MNSQRVISFLTIDNGSAVKTRRFESPTYIGDPVNTVRLWSEMCVDEIACVDISERRAPVSERTNEISAMVDEAFVPLSIGGGIASLYDAESLFGLGIEKVILGWSASRTLSLADAIATRYGSQAVSCCIDYTYVGTQIVTLGNRGKEVVEAREVAKIVRSLSASGIGEFIVQCVDRDGEFCGYDLQLAAEVFREAKSPVVVLGGCGDVGDVTNAHRIGCAAAAASVFVFRGKTRQVLIGNPFRDLHSWSE